MLLWWRRWRLVVRLSAFDSGGPRLVVWLVVMYDWVLPLCASNERSRSLIGRESTTITTQAHAYLCSLYIQFSTVRNVHTCAICTAKSLETMAGWHSRRASIRHNYNRCDTLYAWTCTFVRIACQRNISCEWNRGWNELVCSSRFVDSHDPNDVCP